MAETNQPKNKFSSIWLVVILAVACCCLTVLSAGLGAIIFKGRLPWATGRAVNTQQSTEPDQFLTPSQFSTRTPSVIDPGQIASPTPTETPDPIPLSSMAGANESLQTMLDEIVPINDPIDLGERLGGKADIPETFPDPDTPYAVGDLKDFWVTNVDTNDNFQISTTLRYLGENVYIWIQNGVSYDEADLKALGDTFDDEIYPINREFFGSEWSPGVDEDPHIYIVYAGGLGYSLAGYFSSADELHPDAHEYSNAHEMFLINSDNVFLWEEYIYGTLAHEFQHMIHWYTDKNEETWLNEGFSMLAELINGYDPGGFDFSYVVNPDLQLTDWGGDVGNNGPHYGAAMLFTTYFLDRFGEDATKAVVAHDKNGMESIDVVLTDMDFTDPLTGKPITAEDVFADWAAANLLGDSSVSDGRYAYGIYPSAPTVSSNPIVSTCPTGNSSYTVKQLGVDYLEVACTGDFTLNFSGNTTVPIMPTSPYSGVYFLWSNMGDESDMSLEQTFDLTDISGPVEMTYQTWYDLEEDYDYVFVSASTDGERWQILDSTSCTTEDPSGNSYGCGLNGKTDGWQEETVDLSAFAGEEVTVRFDYVTDAAVNGVGMVIDDVSVDAIGYFSDFEMDEGGWQADGFVRIQNLLPQFYRISMVTFGDDVEVIPLELDENNQASIDISLGEDIDSIVLVISGTTLYTRQEAEYQVEIDQLQEN